MPFHDRQLAEALVPFVQALERLGATYFVGGSVASSYHGIFRRTQDVDVIVDAQPAQIRAVARLLAQDYFIDAAAWIDAFRHGQAFNVFHIATMIKIDVMPLTSRPFLQEEARRTQLVTLDPGIAPVRLVSPEDAVLAKLDWYRLSPSQRQWSDILGVIRQQEATLDLPYLRQWADRLQVRALLEQALIEAQTQRP